MRDRQSADPLALPGLYLNLRNFLARRYRRRLLLQVPTHLYCDFTTDLVVAESLPRLNIKLRSEHPFVGGSYVTLYAKLLTVPRTQSCNWFSHTIFAVNILSW